MRTLQGIALWTLILANDFNQMNKRNVIVMKSQVCTVTVGISSLDILFQPSHTLPDIIWLGRVA